MRHAQYLVALEQVQFPEKFPTGVRHQRSARSFRHVLFDFILAGLVLIASANLHAQTPAASGTVVTIAGKGSFGLGGDGGPATNASFNGPLSLAVGPDGALYIADNGNSRVRAVNPATAIISTSAGTVQASGFDGTGDGGPATNATFLTISGLAVDRARNTLYVADGSAARVRKVNLATGIISNFAGVGIFYPYAQSGLRGDGGPATEAWFSPAIWAIAIDGVGNVYIAEDCSIRKVDAVTGIIHLLAGKPDPGTLGMTDIAATAGDGGPAADATFSFPISVAADASGNVFILDINGPDTNITTCVRRIDAITGIITRIAGGGTNASGTGPALGAYLGGSDVITVDPAGRTLYIDGGTNSQVFKLDLVTGQLTPFAGDGIAGFSGDGGPALNAEFDSINALMPAPGGGLLISDGINQRVRYVVPDSIILTNDNQQTAFQLPWVSALAGDLTVTNNTSLSTISLASLTVVNGSVNVIGNPGSTSVDLSSLTTVNGSVNVTSDGAENVDLSSLSVVSGSVNVTSDGATAVDLSSLQVVNGSVNVTSDGSANSIDLGSLSVVSGSVNIDANAVAITVNLSSIQVVTGSFSISSNTSMKAVDLASLNSVGGSFTVTNNTAANVFNLSSLTNVIGNITITSNAPNATIDLNSLTSIGTGTNSVTLTVDGTIILTNGLIIGTNATLAGNATVSGSVTNKGTVSPGNSPGHIGINGNLVLGGSSKLQFQLAGYAPGQFDSINVTNDLTLGGALSVSLIDNFPSVMTNGASFTLITAGHPFTGAFANVADGGILTTTDGYARFTVHYAGQTAVRLADLVIVDSDGDGMPDWWEDKFGLNKGSSADASLDLDGDGESNLNEFLAGTDPGNPASVFHVITIQPEADAFRIIWSSVGGKGYRVQTNGNLTGPFGDFSPLITAAGAGEATTNFLDPGVVTNAAARYYRVRLGP
jgi:hypothetical protein